MATVRHGSDGIHRHLDDSVAFEGGGEPLVAVETTLARGADDRIGMVLAVRQDGAMVKLSLATLKKMVAWAENKKSKCEGCK